MFKKHFAFLLSHACIHQQLGGKCTYFRVPALLPEHHAMNAYWGSGGIVPLILRPRH